MVVEITDNCPICNGPIPDEKNKGKFPGALSRYDNETEVCSKCGVAEAMLEFNIGKYRSPSNSETYTFEEWKIMINTMIGDE